MDDWVERAMARWPDVPALYGWLRLDRRGRWRIRDGVVTNRRIVEVMNRNYAADARGCWYFQNGPQRGYVALDYAPLVLRAAADGGLETHTGARVAVVEEAFLDEDGNLTLATEQGPGLLRDHDLEWALERLRDLRGSDPEARLTAALRAPTGVDTELALAVAPGVEVPMMRCEAVLLPRRLGFVREPAPDTATVAD